VWNAPATGLKTPLRTGRSYRPARDERMHDLTTAREPAIPRTDGRIPRLPINHGNTPPPFKDFPAMRMTLATYNIHACIGADGQFGPQRTVQVLKELDTDIIALQEVEHHSVDELDLLDYLAEETGMTALAGPTLLRQSRHYGNALLTRLPIVTARRVDLSLPRCEPRGALDVMLDWHGKRVRVIATHLGLRPGERRRQVRRLLSLLETGAADYSVLLGDLNEWLLWGRPLRWLHRQFAPTPHLPTFPARLPLFALDRIWARPRAALDRIVVHTSAAARLASDHLPLRAELTGGRGPIPN
jgi:endonuclease/exonuclease/phosphatase family metal-dependent hydrolase